MIEKALQLIDIVIQNSQQLTGAASLEITHLQMLEMVIGFDSEFVLDGLGQIAPEQAIEIFKQRFGTPNHKGKECQHRQLGWHRLGSELGQPRILLFDHHIDGQTN